MDKSTKRKLIGFLFSLFCLGAFCGLENLMAFLKGLGDIFLPLFPGLLKLTIESYFTSPGFIVGVILFLFSLCGFYISHKAKNKLFRFVSILLSIVSIFSFGNGVFY